MEMKPLNEELCKGIVQQGPRKGLQCRREKGENGYCIHHQRNYEYDQLLAAGKKICNGFFRGCNNELTSDDLSKDRKFCLSCRAKKLGKEFPCKLEGCKAKIKKEEDKYCEKHIRHLLRDDEKERNVQYCDISRGCFNILTNDVKCEECRNKERQKTASELVFLRQKYDINLPERKEKDELFEKQESISVEVKEVWRSVQRSASLKKRLFTLTQEDFEKLVIQPCYYCGFYSMHRFVGIDRIDNNKGYILENCIPACKMCNLIKNADHPNAFLDKVDMICAYRQSLKPISNKDDVKWVCYLSKSQMRTYNDYKYISEQVRSIKFLLSEKHYEMIQYNECYLCGIRPMDGHRNGIDRLDSNGDYTLENCKACCGHCNKMKRDYSYVDFIRKCIQIKAHACDRIKFVALPQNDLPLEKLENEYYTVQDIAIFLRKGHLTRFLEWCEEKGKTAEFKSAITHIASKVEGDIEEQIKRELDNERTRKVRQPDNSDKKHLHCATVYAWLTGGKEEDFLSWYDEAYEKTSLFDKQFKELTATLPTLDREDGIKACKKFMYDEKSRRNTQKIREEKCRETKQYTPSPISQPTPQPTQNILVKLPVRPANIFVEKVTIRKEPVKQESKPIPKQWKAADVYTFISGGNETTYLETLKENNDINNISDFQTKWNALLQTVKNKSFKDAESAIRTFIQWLRTIRHNQLCAITNSQQILEKEGRQHYRTDGILVLFNTGSADQIANFKKHTEDYAGDSPADPKWETRWNSFVKSVENGENDEVKKECIAKFLRAQRKKKMDRSKIQNSQST
jgi:hypothetical protein